MCIRDRATYKAIFNIDGKVPNFRRKIGNYIVETDEWERETSYRPPKLCVRNMAVSYTHLRAHETRHDLVCRLLLEKKKHEKKKNTQQKTTLFQIYTNLLK